MKIFIPDVGDIVWMDLDPVLGKEQAGKRPVLILTPKLYNQFGLCVTVPISSTIKGFNTEVLLKKTKIISGVVLTNHIRTNDWQLRNASFVEKLDNTTLLEIKLKIKVLLDI